MKGTPLVVNREELERLYVHEGKPMKDVADAMGISAGAVHKFIHQYGISVRKGTWQKACITPERNRKVSAANKGRKLTEEQRKHISEAKYKGGIGYKKKRNDGYIAVHFPDHPMSDKEGLIMEHVLVMESIIGRHLKPEECVHHKNGIRDDNRACNLQLMTHSEHMSYHMKKRHAERRNGLSIA